MLTEEEITKKVEEQEKIKNELTLDEIWEDTELDEEEEKAEEKEEEVKEDEEKEEEEKVGDEKEDEKQEDKEEKDEDEEKEGPENKIDWEALGFPKFKGKTDQEVAEQIKFERQQLGHTVNMLGDLRRENAELKSKKEVKEEKKPKKKDVLASIPELDDADAAKFNAMYEKNPIKAIMAYGSDSIKQMIADEVKSVVPKGSMDEVNKVKDEIAYATFLNTAKPTDVEVQQMQIFDDPQYLGKQKRSYSDLHNLSKMWLSEDEDIAAIRDNVYNLMIKHPTMSFDEAKGYFGPKEEKKVPVVDKKKIKETINKNKKAESHPKKKSNALPSNDKSFDDAWDEA